MNAKYITSIGAFLLAGSLLSASAAVVSLEFRTSGAQGAIFDLDANTGTVDGSDTPVLANASLDFAAFVAGSPVGTVNATGSGFGINAPGGSDATDQIDLDEGIETLRITFNTAGSSPSITLLSFDISLWGGSDAGTYSINGGSGIALTGGSNIVNQDVTGLSVDFTISAGNGYSLDGVTFDDGVVPEPASLALIGSGVLVLFQFRRRKLCDEA